MNAILLFDPSNDLVFAKSSKLFRKRLLAYSKLQGLLAQSPITNSPERGKFAATANLGGKRRRLGGVGKLEQGGSSLSSSSSLTKTATSSSSCERAFSSQAPHQRHQAAGSGVGASEFLPPPTTTATTLTSSSATAAAAAASSALNKQRSSAQSTSHLSSRRSTSTPLKLSDADPRYLELLMLLLTPYVASLRLSSSLAEQERRRRTLLAEPPPAPANYSPSSSSSLASACPQTEEEDLLTRFMGSIRLKHECGGPTASETAASSSGAGTMTSGDEAKQRARQKFTSTTPAANYLNQVGDELEQPARFAALPMPVECLSECQIVYCQLYDFIFIHFQQLQQVSSFKMRLLQKRVDLFARLALLLFGPSLGSLRHSAANVVVVGPGEAGGSEQEQFPDQETVVIKKQPPPVVRATLQAGCLRQLYDCWLRLQFEPHYLLEANERLLVSEHIELQCSEALKALARHLRQPSGAYRRFGETHMHALLYSGTKLVNKFSCRNSQPLSHDDQLLLQLILNTYNLHHYHHHQVDEQQQQWQQQERIHSPLKRRSRRWGEKNSCYASNYNANKLTYEINTKATSSATCASNRRLDDADLLELDEETWKLPEPKDRLPDQLLVFLATGGPFAARLRVPHLLRLLPLSARSNFSNNKPADNDKVNHPTTLMLISEISTSYLCLQLNRALKVQHELAKQPARVKLSQLAKINDCLCAIKSYFHGPGYESDPIKVAESMASNSRLSTSSAPTKKPPAANSTWGNLFSKYLKGNAPPVERPEGGGVEAECCAARSVYEKLEPLERRQCCQLICRLEDLASSNVHTYMRQTFNLSVDDHKREALLTSVGQALRDSVHTFVIKPQLSALNGLGPSGASYLSEMGEQLDEARALARDKLSDYLDYLAVKSACNLTLGAPLTHDMPALRSFIYVDRARQELLVSPMLRNLVPMGPGATMEADFCGQIMKAARVVSSSGELSHLSRASSSADEADNDDDGDDDGDCDHSSAGGILYRRRRLSSSQESSEGGGGDSGDEASSESNLAELESDNENNDLARESIGRRKATSGQHHLMKTRTTGGGGANLRSPSARMGAERRSLQRPLSCRPPTSRWLLGASSDLVTGYDEATASSPEPSAASSRSQLGSSAYALAISNLGSHLAAPASLSNGSLDELRSAAARCAEDGAAPGRHREQVIGLSGECHHQQQQQLVDENLMKGFTCFIYNRLAQGHTSYSSNDDERRRELAARELASSYTSLPSVVCGDFFNNYARHLFSGTVNELPQRQQPAPPGDSGGAHLREETRKRMGRYQVSCQVSEFDESRATPPRLIRRRLAQVKEELEEEPDEEGMVGPEDEDGAAFQGLKEASGSMSGLDFGVFLRSQAAGRPRHQGHRSRVHLYRSQRQLASPSGPSEQGRAASVESRPHCYELFCIHKANLLVHRSQVLAEAERLARRLAATMEQSGRAFQ